MPPASIERQRRAAGAATGAQSSASPARAGPRRAFAALVVNRYLDDLAAKLPLRKQAGVRRIQWELACGANLVGATTAAQPDAGREAVIMLAKLLTRKPRSRPRAPTRSTSRASPAMTHRVRPRRCL